MKYFIIRSDGAYISFDGMVQQDIVNMLQEQGLTCTFIDEVTYVAYIQANQP